MSVHVRRLAAAMLALVLLGLVGCSSSDDGGSDGSSGGGIAATVKDFEISLGADQAQAGSVEFDIHNDGPSTHEFVVFKTDLDGDELPVEGGEVNEDASELESMGEQEDIASGSDTTLSVDLQPGHYVIICNITGHYEAGMHTELTVS